MNMERIDVFQKYGIDKENEIIKISLTQENYLRENPQSEITENYQKLEFLGDRIVSFIVADYLYKYRRDTEGIMSQELQILTSNNEHYNYSKYLRVR